MSQEILEGISQTQRERLFYIDFKVRFLGLINRPDLVRRFGIKAAAATRDISLYKDLVPTNLLYDTRARTYITSAAFKPLFQYPENQALTALLDGFGDDCVSHNPKLLQTESPQQLNVPNLDILADITKAIHQKKRLTIEYYSLSSGHSTREISPFALVDNGLRWHVRAYDQQHQRFSDFVINRIAEATPLKGQIPNSQSQVADTQWNRIVEVCLAPHPTLNHPEIIEKEYKMKDGHLKIQIRAALVGYFLRRWGVDCSEKHTMSTPEVHLWLKNRQALRGVDSFNIAPGYIRPC